MSGLGKGIVASSIMKILQFYGLKVSPIKFDGYLNYDCGTMNPYRHGEVFVLDDGGEVDMDFGNYERFLNIDITKNHSITGGKLFSKILEKERKGEYLGEDVQFIPHVVNEILNEINEIVEKDKADVGVIEVGGTVGDVENNYFIEAMRELALKEKVVFVNVTYVPKLSVVGEQKTKPTQISLRMLMQTGIRPNFLVCRGEEKINEKTRRKLALFSNLPEDHIIDDPNIKTIYRLPLYFLEQGFDKLLLKELELEGKLDTEKVENWKRIVENIENPNDEIEIAIVGKYTELHDAYASVIEAITHASGYLKLKTNIRWVESEILESDDPQKYLKGVHGIIVPGGFGKRGIEGMIKAIEFARNNKIPYLGLCLGMQLMTIEFARNVCGLKGANSTEFDKDTKYKVIDLLPSQIGIDKLGGTMRLGAWECVIKPGTRAYESYGKERISERHRHRYEVNNEYREILTKNGLVISGTTPDNSLVEIVEWGKEYGFGIGTQAHPELKSRPEAPAPLFISFLKAAQEYKNSTSL